MANGTQISDETKTAEDVARRDEDLFGDDKTVRHRQEDEADDTQLPISNGPEVEAIIPQSAKRAIRSRLETVTAGLKKARTEASAGSASVVVAVAEEDGANKETAEEQQQGSLQESTYAEEDEQDDFEEEGQGVIANVEGNVQFLNSLQNQLVPYDKNGARVVKKASSNS